CRAQRLCAMHCWHIWTPASASCPVLQVEPGGQHHRVRDLQDGADPRSRVRVDLMKRRTATLVTVFVLTLAACADAEEPQESEPTTASSPTTEPTTEGPPVLLATGDTDTLAFF